MLIRDLVESLIFFFVYTQHVWQKWDNSEKSPWKEIISFLYISMWMNFFKGKILNVSGSC